MEGKWSVYILLVAAILSALLLAGLGSRTASASAPSSWALQDDAEEPDDEDEEVEDDVFEERVDNPFCENYVLAHPVAARLGEIYDVEYETVMDWFCRGFGFGQIMLALQTASITENEADTFLERRQVGEGWGQIWRDQGLIGRRAGAGPPDHAGPPANAGRPDDAGRPEDAGRPDDAGPPPHAGRPEDAGPPPHAGPPDHAGRPEDAGRLEDAEPLDDEERPEDAPLDDEGRPDDAGPSADAGAPDAGLEPEEGGEVYVVRPGDRLAEIAAAFGVELEMLAEANNIENINHIEVGQVLIIPR